MTSLLNKAIYYWDWYLLYGDIDNLVAAHNFMKDYKDGGGEDYENTFEAMKDHVKNRLSPLPIAGKSPILAGKELEPLIFGLTHAEIAFKQGIKGLR